ncbi:hypothetical protein FF011L_40980 [Roseimaritima multifibrata]|uniref:Uncharacterized protein n=1 Tax=Roseimaritima multifibrata TaxID=1930274 RepID=A0A517MK89_9BACT|nr:hypothetical protein FF011L_40980 [Roseimaritima multifibrata]
MQFSGFGQSTEERLPITSRDVETVDYLAVGWIASSIQSAIRPAA